MHSYPRRPQEADGLTVTLELDDRRAIVHGCAEQVALDLVALLFADLPKGDSGDVHSPAHDDSSAVRDGEVGPSPSIDPTVEGSADTAARVTPPFGSSDAVGGGAAAASDAAAAPSDHARVAFVVKADEGGFYIKPAPGYTIDAAELAEGGDAA